MTIQILLFLLGLIFLYWGAVGLVKGSSQLAAFLGVRPMVIGLTVVAFATSSPEGMISLMAVWEKTSDVALGNIIGSNIANIGLVLGLSAIVAPLEVNLSTLKKEFPIMILAALLFYMMALDLKISRLEGFLLFMGIICFIVYCIYDVIKSPGNNGQRAVDPDALLNPRSSWFSHIFFIIIGLIGLLGGAYLMVKSAVFVARELGISELVIGLSMVALGTSLPELMAAIVGSYRRESDIVMGNIIGSNIFNILFVIGLIALVNPLTLSKGILRIELPVMILFSLVLFLLMRTGFVLNRSEGLLLLVGYGAFISYLFLGYF
jgi:cation:H+ antiporter